MFTEPERLDTPSIIAGAEVASLSAAQLATTLALNTALNPNTIDPSRIVDIIGKAQRLDLIPAGLSPITSGVTQLVEALKNAPAQICADLGPLGQACIQVGLQAEQLAKPLLRLVRWEISDAVEAVMGPFRMAGLIVIANRLFLPQVGNWVKDYIPNDLAALAVAEALIVTATALANSVIPVFLRGGFGSFGQSFGVGVGVAAMTTLPEMVVGSTTGNERAGQFAGILGQVGAAAWFGWPAVEAAINVARLLI